MTICPWVEEDRGECERDGITIHAGWGQTEIVTEDGHAAGIRFRKCLRVKNDQGRFAPSLTTTTPCQAAVRRRCCTASARRWIGGSC